jgi:hypothetical protein
LSMFGIDMYENVLQLPPISSNIAQPLKSGTTFHRQQPDELYGKLCHTRYWLVFRSTPLPFLLRYVTNTHILVFPVVKSIDWGQMNLYWQIALYEQENLWNSCIYIYKFSVDYCNPSCFEWYIVINLLAKISEFQGFTSGGHGYMLGTCHTLKESVWVLLLMKMWI